MKNDFKTASLFTVDGKVIAITGGAGILGSQIAKCLADNGAKVAVLDLDFKRADQLAKEIRKNNGTAIALLTDVLSLESLRQAANEVIHQFGQVNILINGAGGNHPSATTSSEKSFFDLPPEALKFVFDLNIAGTIYACQVFGKLMAEQKHGVILNISSMNAFRPLTQIPAYSAAKAAVSNFTQWLAVYMAQEYSPEIRVNAIAPGFFLTQQNEFLLKDQTTGGLTVRGKKIIEHTPMNRFGEPKDLYGTILWLLSPASSFVTGIVVPVDGGFSAYSGV